MNYYRFFVDFRGCSRNGMGVSKWGTYSEGVHLLPVRRGVEFKLVTVMTYTNHKDTKLTINHYRPLKSKKDDSLSANMFRAHPIKL